MAWATIRSTLRDFGLAAALARCAASLLGEVGDQIGHGLRRKHLLESFGHEGEAGTGELSKIGAEDGFFAVGGAQGDAVGGFGGKDAAEFAVVFGNRGVIDVAGLDSAVGIETLLI